MVPPPSIGASLNLPPSYVSEDNSTPLLATCISFLIIESIFVILMYISRFCGKDKAANLWMTFLMTAGYIVCVGKISIGICEFPYCVIGLTSLTQYLIVMVRIGGAGHHLLTLSFGTIINTLKLQTALQIMCPLATSLTKLGICLLFLEIFGRTSQRYRIVIKATFALVLAVLIIQFIIPFANCKPFNRTWSPEGQATSCAFSGLTLWRYLSIPNILTTVIMVCIPLPALYNLHINTPSKLGLGLVFSVAILGSVAAIMRFHAFLSVRDFSDITFELIAPLSWTIAESGIYLIAGVMPTLRPLIKKVAGNDIFDKMVSRGLGRSTGSWGNKRGSKMFAKPLPPLPAMPRKDSIDSENFDFDFSEKSGKSSRAEMRETVLSAQEQSVVIMMERESRTTNV